MLMGPVGPRTKNVRAAKLLYKTRPILQLVVSSQSPASEDRSNKGNPC
jgi:hypothetical protein